MSITLRDDVSLGVQLVGTSALRRDTGSALCLFHTRPHMLIPMAPWTRLLLLWPRVTKPPAFLFQVFPSPPVPKTTQGFIGWRSGMPGLNKCLEHDNEIRSCKGAYARELKWPEQGVH